MNRLEPWAFFLANDPTLSRFERAMSTGTG